jgi:EAL domain-containing protein (putative c-di-GMP-specific phosphodiesterase class I)/PAS domain-containing protein
VLAAWEWDARTDVVRFAPAAVGEPPAPDAGLAAVLGVMPSPYRETLERGVRGVAAGRSAFDLRHPVLGPDGPLWAETRIRPWRDVAGEPRGVRASTRDVDAELQARWATERSRDLYRATLDTLDAHVAVLDADGVIVATNSAWDRFADANGGRAVGVGSDYLAACDIAGADEPLAVDVARALREIIAGGRREFTAEYPCHARHEQRWFAMRAAVAEAGGAVRVVVQHQDVTASRETVERELRVARAGSRAAAHAQNERAVERLREALRLDRFVLHAQPIVDVRTGATVQHELLIRMREENGRLAVPSSFLPIAERHGLIRSIDRWVVRRGLALAGEGHAVQLNVSAESLGDRTLAPYVETELSRASADPSRVVFELTETALLNDAAAAEDFLRRVRALGCKVALDDFGTGYGGFLYLKRLPVDFLKVDIEFVRDLPHHPASQHVVEAVVSLARGFGIGTIAEGVEDDETLALLGRFGVDHAQGFGIRPPGPLDEVL